jgi:hypothetical protein
MNMRVGRIGFASVVAVFALAVSLSATAFGDDITREEYVAQAEPICKVNTLANRKIFKGVRQMVQQNKLDKAAQRFKRAAASLRSTITQLAALPQPSADQTRLSKWLDYLDVERSFLTKIGKALAADNKFQAQNYIVRLRRNSNLANNTVLAFEFNYCRIDPARFT